MIFDWRIVIKNIPLFKQALLNTFYLSLVSLFMALLVGFVGGLCRVSKNKYIRGKGGSRKAWNRARFSSPYSPDLNPKNT